MEGNLAPFAKMMPAWPNSSLTNTWVMAGQN